MQKAQENGSSIRHPELYEHIHHNYSDTAFYFLTSATTPGKQIMPAAEPSQPATYSSSESDVCLFMNRMM